MKFEIFNKAILTILSLLVLIISSFILSNKSYAKYSIEEKIFIGTIKIIKQKDKENIENQLESKVESIYENKLN